MPVVNLSLWDQAARSAIVDVVFDNPHAFTVEDVAWAAEKWGADEAGCRRMFTMAPKLAALMVNEQPVYLFAASEDGRLSTASAAGLEGKFWTLTKELIRFSRSPEGKAFCAGTVGFLEDGDLQKGTVRAQWVKALGYTPKEAVEFQGDVYHICYPGG